MTPERLKEIKTIQHQIVTGEMSVMDFRKKGGKALYDCLEALTEQEVEKKKADELIKAIYAEKLLEIPFDTKADVNNYVLEARRRLSKDRVEAYCIHNNLIFQLP